ncbi:MULTISPECIES: rhodanese-like domain-containing protein [unclassified Haladaptatus]|uniref:rhodanese-like domain-containing protein n=1 Tax=unclassified Haladaptatus TaxID=2622732 RepID=UPI0023E851E8|nr:MULTISPECIES: rhodanese-like domain-containing protein [unclassified Haladaptatus]
MSKVRPAELAARLERGEQLFVLDIRPESNFHAGHIDGSQNIPVYDDLRRGNTATLEDRLGAIPADRDVVTVCKAGIVAKRATKVLEAEGYEAKTLEGGWRGWRGYQSNSLGYRLKSAVNKLLP